MKKTFKGALALINMGYLLTWTFNGASGLASGVPTFNNMGLVGNSYGLTTPTPSKSEFDQVRPSETIPDGSLSTVLSQWLADPTALQFTYQNNTPWYNTINIWNTTLITDMNNLFLNNTDFQSRYFKLGYFKCYKYVKYVPRSFNFQPRY